MQRDNLTSEQQGGATSRSRAPYCVVLGLTSGRVSGVDTFSVHLARHLSSRGIPSRILLTQHDQQPPDPLPLPPDVACEHLDLSRGATLTSRLNTLVERLSHCGPCVYIPNYDYDHSWACVKLPRHVAVVGIVHSDDPLHYAHARRLGRNWNALVAVSDYIGARVAQIDEQYIPRLHVIPYGVPVRPCLPGRFSGTRNSLRVLYVGRMAHKQKRPQDVIRVVAATAGLGVPVELTMVGGGAELKSVTDFANRHLERGTFRMRGILSNAEVLRECDQHDVLLLTSAFEGLPVAMLEAMERGCIPVVSRIASGIPDIIRDGENGFSVPLGDISGYSRKLAMIFNDPQFRTSMAKAARQTIETRGYRVQDMTDRYANLFQHVLEQSQSGAFERPRGEFPARRLAGLLPYSTWRAGRRQLACVAKVYRFCGMASARFRKGRVP